MPDNDRIDQLLSLYERRRASGQTFSDQELQELCRQHPEELDELRRRIALLQLADQFLDLPQVVESIADAAQDHVGSLARPSADLPGIVNDTQPDRPPGGAAHPADLLACIGPYEVGAELKKGGMGRIVRVWDVNFKRPLALKMVRGRHPQMEQRLVYEGRLTGCLQHPGIPPVHDQGRLADGRPYFIMKLIQGHSLSDLLRQRTSPTAELPRFLLIFEQLCEAVGYAHSRKVIHRDLKPGNIMVGAFGEVQVIDWGLAKLVRAPLTLPPGASVDEPGTIFGLKQTAALAGTQTTVGTALGTPAYMAPEQARSELDQLDARADVFGLGAILCEVLTGGPPYLGHDVYEILARAKRADLTEAGLRLQECRADEELLALARTCLTTNREDRPADGAAVAREVAAYRKEVQRRLEEARTEKAVEAARAEQEKKLRVAESVRAEEEKKLRVAESAGPEEERRRRQAEQQRRRVQLVLAATVLLGVLASGVVFWQFHERQRAADLALQQQRADAEVKQALVNAQVLLEQVKAGPLFHLDQFQSALAEALKAKQLAHTAGASDELSRQATDLVARILKEKEAAQRDYQLQLALLEIRNPRSGPLYTADEGGLMAPLVELSVDDQYLSAFRIWGLEVDKTVTATAVARLQERPPAVLVEVIVALEEWASERRQNGLPAAKWRPLLELVEALDPADAKRRALRTLLAGGTLSRERALGQVAWALALWPKPMPVDLRWGKDRHWVLQVAAQTDAAREPVLGLLTLVRALRIAGEEEQAESLLRKAIRFKPRAVVLWHYLGQVLVGQTPPRWGQALECYMVARGLRPDLGISLANVQIEVGRTAEGLALYERLTAENPHNPWLPFCWGQALIAQGRNQEAAAAFRKGIALDPHFAQAYNGLGVALHNQGDLPAAIVQYRQAIALDPHQAQTYHNLGVALFAQKDLAGALAQYRKALTLDPNYAPAQHNLRHALEDQKVLGEALPQQREAIDLDPHLALAYNNLGWTLYAPKDLPKAIAHYRQAIDLDPYNARAYYNLGVSLHVQKNLAGAIAHFRKAIALNPNYVQAYYNLGNALYAQKDLPEALVQYRKAIAIDPNNAQAYNNLGVALRAQKDLEGALTQFRKAIAIYPTFAKAYHNLGNGLRAQQNFPEAIRQYRKAIALDPNFAQAYYNLGEALLHQGQFVEAQQATLHYQQLLSLNHSWQQLAHQQLQRCERLRAIERQLEVYFAKGEIPPSAQEQLALIDLCRTFKRYHATAARLYAAAFAAHPALAEQLEPQHRFQAACSALLAVAGQASDPSPPKEQEKTQLRQQALAWLQADLQQWTKWFQQRDGKALLGLVHVLPRWQQHPALTVVRDAKQRVLLAEEEQKNWQQLWADLEQFQKQGTAQMRMLPFQGTLTVKDREQTHEVKLQADQVYLIDLESKDFDVYLRLYNPQGKLLVANDRLAPGNLTAGLLFTAPADGAYRLLASSFEQRDTGAYTLTVRSFVARQK